MLQVTAVIASNQKDGSIEINMLGDNEAGKLDVSQCTKGAFASDYRKSRKTKEPI